MCFLLFLNITTAAIKLALDLAIEACIYLKETSTSVVKSHATTICFEILFII